MLCAVAHWGFCQKSFISWSWSGSTRVSRLHIWGTKSKSWRGGLRQHILLQKQSSLCYSRNRYMVTIDVLWRPSSCDFARSTSWEGSSCLSVSLQEKACMSLHDCCFSAQDRNRSSWILFYIIANLFCCGARGSSKAQRPHSFCIKILHFSDNFKIIYFVELLVSQNPFVTKSWFWETFWSIIRRPGCPNNAYHHEARGAFPCTQRGPESPLMLHR